MKPINITGNRYGKLVVKGISNKRNRHNDILWECICDCGGTKLYTSGNLRNGDAKTCGCGRDRSRFIGIRYTRLVVKSFTNQSDRVILNCDCGVEIEKNWNDVKSGHTKSCGCLQREGRPGVDLTGQSFGYLKVISKTDERNKFKDILWNCICFCGKEKLCTTGALQHGGNTSCGCMAGGPTHRDWNNRIRHIWVGMMARCYNPKSTSWRNYGAKGVTVCAKWKDYFVFKKWALQSGYDKHLTLDRFPDKKGNYMPSNCRWATYKQQANNKLNNRKLRFHGQSKTISEWADIFGIKQQRLRDRLILGWSIKDALTKPVDKTKISKKYRKDASN